MPLAVIALDFDPVVRLGEWAIRMDTLVAALGVLLALVLAAAIARRMPAKGSEAIAGILRPDDVLFIALAAMPGALIGGRLGYVLLHLEYYAANPTAFVDPAQGSLELALAVVGGALTGGYGARVLSGSAARWFDVAAVPTLAALAVGKLAMAAAGSGQGIPWQGSWATAYVGPGPWGSLAAGFPAHPAQLY
ncbi:MAG TPA: prolipoprotein diacylglyceryl transferase family protein, partial [Vitreimonas sp.]|nr:prolipoprotein diacylglyceryl transferase family protein [Vitreimonas sp.]